eukprot:TRINITY_DN3265_c0_g1_i1.p5 TRINITY_DN3265_c0_g1~~TRINITY_DN3265_c0_g1_i1.p5  ORF type:complete len:137 (-),score=63.06 TRINITY_DN3265_c0_g1_i1:148-558(-)
MVSAAFVGGAASSALLGGRACRRALASRSAGAAAPVARRRGATMEAGGDGGEDVEARRERFRVSPVFDDPLARRTVGPKRFSKAATQQENMSFQDAWAAKNGRVIDIWVIVGLLFIVIPPAIIGWALSTGVIPGLV